MTVLILKYQGSNADTWSLHRIEYSSSVDLTFELLISNQEENYNGMNLEINCGELFFNSKTFGSFVKKLRSEGKYNYNYNSRPRTSFVPFKEDGVYQFTFANEVLKVKEKEDGYYLEVGDIGLLERVEEVRNFSYEEFEKQWDLSTEKIILGKEVMRIKGKLGDVSDVRLQKLVDDERVLPLVRNDLRNTEIQRDSLQNNLQNERDAHNDTQQKLIQVQSERDDYKNKWDVSLDEIEQKQEIIKQLINEVNTERLENIAHGEMLERRHFEQRKGDVDDFLTIQTKKKELKELKNNAKSKLDNSQRFLILTLLTLQEQLIRLEETSSQLISLTEKQLSKTKQNLKIKLSNDEISNLCKLQIEITQLEMRLESLSEQFQARIEILTNN